MKKIWKMNFLKNLPNFWKKIFFRLFKIKNGNFPSNRPGLSDYVMMVKNAIYCQIGDLAKIEKMDFRQNEEKF